MDTKSGQLSEKEELKRIFIEMGVKEGRGTVPASGAEFTVNALSLATSITWYIKGLDLQSMIYTMYRMCLTKIEGQNGKQ